MITMAEIKARTNLECDVIIEQLKGNTEVLKVIVNNICIGYVTFKDIIDILKDKNIKK